MRIEHFTLFYRREKCNSGNGYHPIYVNVNMNDGSIVNNWIDSLSAAWPAVQVYHHIFFI